MSDAFHTDSGGAAEAQRQLEAGVQLESDGKPNAALAAYRKAVVLNPALFDAQLRIGLICKEASRSDPMLKRHAFEAFRAAARLNPSSDVAQDQYILSAQAMGRLDEIRDEYGALAKQSPADEGLQRRYKMVLAMSMAMLPVRPDMQAGRPSPVLRGSILFFSLGIALIGVGMIVIPFLMGRSKLEGSQLESLVKSGLAAMAAGLAGVIVALKMR